MAKPASLRPEKIAVLAEGAAAPEGAVVISGTVSEVLYHGATKRIEVATDAGRLVAAVPAREGPAVAGGSVRLVFSPDALHLMDAS